ncbi:MAG: hypothetical protein O3B90_05600 [Actinomycetota bacterium]|nr:hypothetical protein [Actinomycetota bacterium]
MAKLVLFVVAAAWAAVLIPPMLRSRIDNRPNSSVIDFRQQLNKLQSNSMVGRGPVRSMGRPLAQSSSPLQRQAAGGRPGGGSMRQASARSGDTATRQRPVQRPDQPSEVSRYRSHGDLTRSQRRPDTEPINGRSSKLKRRRMNVLFVLLVTAACTMFLAATTHSTAMLWAFGLSFLGLCGYVYVLAELRERESADWNNGWLEQR